MPSMSVSHGGILYYVVKIPKSELDAMSPDSERGGGGGCGTTLSGPIIKVDSEGWDNPFRPDGDLSKEADQIVELIKEGKPINEENLRSKSPSVNESFNVSHNNQLNASPRGKEANGTTVNGSGGPPDTVTHGVVPPAGQAAQVEHVVLKKKKGCCVIQ